MRGVFFSDKMGYTKNGMKTLKESVLQTLAYFDIFDHPLTKEELHRALWKRGGVELESFMGELEACVAKGVIGHQWGYYFLPGREAIVETRRRRTLIVERKMKIAQHAIKKMRWIPFIRAVFVCNTLGVQIARKEGDIDICIISEKGRIWFVRFCALILFALLGMRAGRGHTQDKICLSFYVTRDALDMSALQLGEPDIYLVYWLNSLVPVYDPHHLYHEIQKVNQWTLQYVGEEPLYELLHRWRVDDAVFSKYVRRLFELILRGWFGDVFQKILKRMQTKRIDKNFGDLIASPDSRVVVNDHILKFHDNDRREYYRNEWVNRVNARIKMPENFPAS